MATKAADGRTPRNRLLAAFVGSFCLLVFGTPSVAAAQRYYGSSNGAVRAVDVTDTNADANVKAIADTVT